MIVDADPTAGTVTMRLSTPALVLRAGLAVALGLGTPLLAERTAPALLVPALLVTAAAGWLVVTSLGRTVVIDDHGVTLTASRRSPPRTAWRDLEGLEVTDGALVVVRRDGVRLRGPSCGQHVLAQALEEAALLGLLPRTGDDGRPPP